MSNVKKIILDTDIGDDIDDAFALAMLLRQKEEVDIKGVTTVYRNSAQRALIAKNLILLNGRRDISVYAGIDSPRKNKIYIAPYDTVGGDGKVNIPHYTEDMSVAGFESLPAADFILQTLKAEPGEITLVAIGPLTNLAAAYEKSPEIFRLAKEILFMGGEIAGSYAEWNVKCDPESADIVFGSGVPIKVITLEVTRQCILKDADISRIKGFKTPDAPLLNRMLDKWLKDNCGRRPPIMYDPLAVSELTKSYCKFEDMPVELSLCGETRAMIRKAADGNATVMRVSTNVKARKFIEDFLEIISS